MLVEENESGLGRRRRFGRRYRSIRSRWRDKRKSSGIGRREAARKHNLRVQGESLVRRGRRLVNQGNKILRSV